ncbi:MAG: OmpA family protein [Desulfobacula sp.]|jgi:chemotaxis protein MotB|uniref:peptidoglycan-binding protein n=1 Tax=Desulfobacula sp. TaxID=2593537 RepID=UPI001D6FF37D|nr:OmpA family protein [Desulfobacula sp.]MBT3484995.1 OmpA family protein [Desulfobacula sp.]MBT3804188.1 OmpA family protein [Desulfobacula sp.]MBT4025044.1 OmpA family protein [Desulfobacula sp.]MBT4198646.1 OmpA family protein [Desulfobacula sp.]
MISKTRRISNPTTAWPGYVDVLSALLMVVIFVLMIFVLAQFLLSEVLYGQKNELALLHEQVSELAELLGLEKEKSSQLNTEVGRLSDAIIGLSEDKDELISKVAQDSAQFKKDNDKIKQQMLNIGSLNEDIQTLTLVKDELEQKVADLALSLSDKDYQVSVLRDRSKALTARLADKDEMTVLAQEKIEKQDIRIQALSVVLESQKEAIAREKLLSASASAEVALLSDQITKLQAQLRMISDALALTKTKGQEKDEKIAQLGKQLNIALARKVSELQKYRSEFFGQLQKIIGNNPAVEIQGDRFVLQAGLLFESGSANLGIQGRSHLTAMANTLLQISMKIPNEINWILRIDGHSDRVPINNETFSSNWELSAARAVSVVRFLSQTGIPEKRMAAAGFSKYHPIDEADTPEAYRKNRRIEIKLTSQ